MLNNSIMAKIQLNGKKVVIKTDYSILDLLDKLEIVHFIGGG